MADLPENTSHSLVAVGIAAGAPVLGTPMLTRIVSNYVAHPARTRAAHHEPRVVMAPRVVSRSR